MQRNRSRRRGRVIATGAVAVAIATLGAGCRDDGNDLIDGEPADTIETSDVADAPQASSTADELADTADTRESDDTDTGPATSAPADGQPSTGTAQPIGTQSPDATDTTAPGATQPLSSDPSSSTTQPPTEPPTVTQPVDAATLAFCDAVVTAETTFTRGPLVDFATATPEEIDAAVTAHAATLEPMLGATVASAPAGIAPDVATVVDFVRSSLATGEDVTSDPDFRAADERVDVFVADSCGYRRVEVSGVDHRFEGLPASLPAARTTFVFTNRGAEIHEMVVFRINDGVTETLDELLALPEEEAFAKVTFIGATFGVQGETDTETVEFTPGRYVALCFVPIGTVDPELGADEPGLPHFTAGMQDEFTVT